MRAPPGVIAALTLLVVCFVAPARAETIDVLAASVRSTTVGADIEGTGTIAAHKTTDILPLVGGLVQDVHVTVGDRVEAGDPLFVMRTIDLELRARELEHALALARAQADDARGDLERSRRLAERGAVSEDLLLDLGVRLAAAEADVGIAETRLASARQALEDAVVRAPYRGVITARNVDEGAFIETRGMMMEPAMQIMKLDIVAAIVLVPEVHVARIEQGTPATVRVDGIDAEFESIVHIKNDRVDAESRSFETRIGIANEDYAVKPGLFCRVTFHPPGREAVVVARGAVVGNAGARFVFVPEQGGDGAVARRRPVRVRELDTSEVEVLEGLAPGDRVLVGPALPRLVDGAAIRVVSAATAGL